MSLYAASLRIAALREARPQVVVPKICYDCGREICSNDVVRLSLREKTWEWSHVDCSNPQKRIVLDDEGIAI